MKLTLEITVESVEQYLQLLNALDQAEENGELGFEWTAQPALDSLPALADNETPHDTEYEDLKR